MSAKANGPSKTRASFGENEGAERPWARKRRLDAEQEVRGKCMKLLAVSGLLLLVAAGGGARGQFVQTIHTVSSGTYSWRYWGYASLGDVLQDDWAWRSALLTAVATPIWFAAWWKNRMAWGRALGAAWSFSGAIVTTCLARPAPDVDYLCGSCWLVVASQCCVGYAFVTARLRDPEALDAVQVRALVRRHRKSE